jgi:hypothetical protein
MSSGNGSGTLRLEPPEAEWIRLKWRAIRDSQQKADAANNDWQRMNSALNRWLDESGITDPVQRTKHKELNLALKEALSMGNWHSRNAERHIHDVQLFLKIRELGVDLS